MPSGKCNKNTMRDRAIINIASGNLEGVDPRFCAWRHCPVHPLNTNEKRVTNGNVLHTHTHTEEPNGGEGVMYRHGLA